VKAYPGCTLGVGDIGYIMMSFGASNSITGLLVGYIDKYIHRLVLATCAILIHIGDLILMVFWQPARDWSIVYFVIPVLWGMTDATLQIIVNGK
jgi:predicted MFS family arabinose efflux permease